MKFADKMKDVELHPYMLAIYKDNEHRHLLHHAIECWNLRPRNNGPIINPPLERNPIAYCRFPPLELVKEYYPGERSYSLLSSRLLACPEVARYAFWANFDRFCGMIELIGLQSGDSDLDRTISLISFNQEEVYQIITAGLLPMMPREFIQALTPEQQATAAICA